MKVVYRNNLQADVWVMAPVKPDLEFLGNLSQLTTLTLENAYHFHLPSTSLTNLTTLHLINTHLPCLQNLFKTSPIKTLSIINQTLPIAHRSLTILLSSMSTTLKELALITPRHQVGLTQIRSIIYETIPDLSILRTTPSFLFSSAGVGMDILLPKKLSVLEILDEKWYGDESDKLNENKVQRLVREMERLRELEVRSEWCSQGVESICAEREVGLFVR